MDKKMIMISVVIIALVSAGAVAAISLNYEPDMKTASFDNIKMKVPVNAKFIKTAAGFEDTNYGITVQTFKNNEAAVNYLKTLDNAKVISVANLPANSIAYKNGDMTCILVTNGNKEALCVGALDQNLDVRMANSIIFPDGKNTKVNHGVMGIGKKLPNADVDFNFILNITKNVNNNIFNENITIEAIDNSTDLTDEYDALNNTEGIGMAGQPESDVEYNLNNSNADNSIEDNSNNDLVNNFNDIVDEDSSSQSSDDSSSIASDDGSSDVSDESSQGTSDGNQDELSKEDCKNLVKDIIPDDYKIAKSTFKNGVYIFEIEDNGGDYKGNVTVDPKTQEIDNSDLEI